MIGVGVRVSAERGKKQLSKDPLKRYTRSMMTSIQVYSLSNVVLCFLSLVLSVSLSGSSISVHSLFPAFLYLMMEVGSERKQTRDTG